MNDMDDGPGDPIRLLATLNDAARVLEAYRFRFANEKELQDGIASAFMAADLTPFVREERLGPGDIVDFLVTQGDGMFCGPRLAVEVKVGGSLTDLLRQLHRYAGYPSVGAILVVTSKSALARLPDTLQGKPVRAVVLAGAFA